MQQSYMTTEEVHAWVLKECSWGRTQAPAYSDVGTTLDLMERGRYLTPERKVTRIGVAFIQRHLKTNIGPHVEFPPAADLPIGE